jgi:hypothetical protein
VKILINGDLATGIPVLAKIIRTVNMFLKDPIGGFGNMAEILSSVRTLQGMFNVTVNETQQILHDVSDIVDSSINLINKVITPQ